jgi:hypothetical protein
MLATYITYLAVVGPACGWIVGCLAYHYDQRR